MAPHCPQPCLEPFKMLVIPGASRPFPWGELRTSPVHVVPVPVPSALSLPGTVGAHLARVWQRRPKSKFVLCIRDPAYTEGLGRMWLRSPCGRGCSDPSAPHHPSKLQTCTHTHARTWEQGPQGAGEQEKEEKASISPKPCQHRAKKSALLPGSSGEHRGAKCPLPHAQVQPPRRSPPGAALSALGALPAAVRLLKLNVCFL